MHEIRSVALVNRTHDIEGESVISNHRVKKIEVGQIFKDKQVLKDAMVYLVRKEEFTRLKSLVLCSIGLVVWMINANG